MAKRSIVGDPINFRGFVYGSVNEMGVVALVAMLSEDVAAPTPMIPDFNEHGYLPPGIHRATPAEIEERFGRGSEIRRAQMQLL